MFGSVLSVRPHFGIDVDVKQVSEVESLRGLGTSQVQQRGACRGLQKYTRLAGGCVTG